MTIILNSLGQNNRKGQGVLVSESLSSFLNLCPRFRGRCPRFYFSL